MEKIAIASDHGGRELKDDLLEFLKSEGMEPVDMGVNNDASVDYPDYGSPVAEKVSNGEFAKAVLLCDLAISFECVGMNELLDHEMMTRPRGP